MTSVRPNQDSLEDWPDRPWSLSRGQRYLGVVLATMCAALLSGAVFALVAGIVWIGIADGNFNNVVYTLPYLIPAGILIALAAIPFGIFMAIPLWNRPLDKVYRVFLIVGTTSGLICGFIPPLAIFVAPVLTPLIAVALVLRQMPLSLIPPWRCQRCAYDLTDLDGTIYCPECGHQRIVIDRSADAPA
ncbi:MAG: hypothetical protein AAGD00_09820 [Planctomycetota bacterium]